jgi:hypothetical protein
MVTNVPFRLLAWTFASGPNPQHYSRFRELRRYAGASVTGTRITGRVSQLSAQPGTGRRCLTIYADARATAIPQSNEKRNRPRHADGALTLL